MNGNQALGGTKMEVNQGKTNPGGGKPGEKQTRVEGNKGEGMGLGEGITG